VLSLVEASRVDAGWIHAGLVTLRRQLCSARRLSLWFRELYRVSALRFVWSVARESAFVSSRCVHTASVGYDLGGDHHVLHRAND